MFLAVMIAALTSLGIGLEDMVLYNKAMIYQAISRETRMVVAQILQHQNHPPINKVSLSSPDDDNNNNDDENQLYITDGRLVSTHTLLQSAANKEGWTSHQYIQRLQTEGIFGGLYGGGPELTVLSNLLRRPISIYELADPTNDDDDDDDDVDENDQNGDNDNNNKSNSDRTTRVNQNKKNATTVNHTTTQSSNCYIRCMGVFGRGLFEDPLRTHLNHSAIASDESPGAYSSWHLHILVLTLENGEKHACVLLPTHL